MMKEKLSETSIVRETAKLAINQIVRKTVADLRRMKVTLSGDSSPLKTTWDEICVQIQDEESVAWAAYAETVKACVDGYVGELAAHEKGAIWLQTESGIDWLYEESEDREDEPVMDDDIIDYIISEYLYPEAERYSNGRIRNYFEQKEW